MWLYSQLVAAEGRTTLSQATQGATSAKNDSEKMLIEPRSSSAKLEHIQGRCELGVLLTVAFLLCMQDLYMSPWEDNITGTGQE